MADSGVVNRFLRQLLKDRLSGELRSLEDYQARFPGAEDAIAEEYRAEVPGGTGDSSAESAPESSEFGPYRIIRLLGRGGQATVYLAEDRRLHRQVALKLLRAAGLESPEGLGPAPSAAGGSPCRPKPPRPTHVAPCSPVPSAQPSPRSPVPEDRMRHRPRTVIR